MGRYYRIKPPNELRHYGVLGMKWGVRKKEPTNKKRTRANNNANKKPKSSYRQKLEKKYTDKGLTKKEASEVAERRIKAQKIVAAAAAITVVAATAYVVNKHLKDKTDTILKAGTGFQVISKDKNKSLDRAFYTAHVNKDKKKYTGLLGGSFNSSGGKVFSTSFENAKDLNIASKDKAKKVFEDLYKNDIEFRKAFHKSNSQMVDFALLSPKLTRAIDRRGYDAFNVGLVNHTPEGNLAASKFYDKLKNSGYHAVLDINDKKYSGYKAKNPIIVFDNTPAFVKKEVKELSASVVESSFKKEAWKLTGETMVKEGSIVAGVVLGGRFAKATLEDIQETNRLIESRNKQNERTK